ncbi:MAG: diguanylate cyclase [Silanimonas sp.]
MERWLFAMRIAVMVFGIAGGAVHAEPASVLAVDGVEFQVRPDCSVALPGPRERVSIPAPLGGWPPETRAVLVLEAAPGLVVVRQDQEVRCGVAYDARAADTRFRAGVGVTLPPPTDPLAPIAIDAPAWRSGIGGLVVRHGAPAPVQREDTARFVVRVAGFAVLFAMLLSASLLAAQTRDRTVAAFAALTAGYTAWIAARSGLVGWPEPWLADPWIWPWVVVILPPFVLLLHTWLVLDQVRIAHLAPTLRGRWWIAPLIAAALAAALALVYDVGLAGPLIRWATLLAALGSAALALWSWRNGNRPALNVLVAIAPALLLVGPWASDLLRDWRVEGAVMLGAWYATTMTIAMSSRTGALRRQRDQLRALAERDALTGLPNRRALQATLLRRLDDARLHHHPLSVLFFDLDHFKRVNDGHGHAVGDEVLVEVGRRLVHGLREGDTAFRQGGEEFVVLLPGADHGVALGIAERLRASVSGAPMLSRAGPLHVSASIGLATLRDGDSPERLLARADAAMYRAKQAGRNRVEAAADVPAATSPK